VLSFTSAIPLSISFSASTAFVRSGSAACRMEMRDQHDQRIADAAKLLAVGADVGQRVLFDTGLARLPKIDIDEPN